MLFYLINDDSLLNDVTNIKVTQTKENITSSTRKICGKYSKIQLYFWSCFTYTSHIQVNKTVPLVLTNVCIKYSDQVSVVSVSQLKLLLAIRKIFESTEKSKLFQFEMHVNISMKMVFNLCYPIKP